MKKRQANWYSLDMLPCYLELSRGQLESAQEQQRNLKRCKDRPWVLDDHIVLGVSTPFVSKFTV